MAHTAACPFDHSEQLEFDPSLAQLMARGPVSRIRLPYGEAEAWLVTTFDGVRQVTTDPRFSRAAIVGRDYPRMTPEPIVSPESINVMDPPRGTRLRHAAARAFTQSSVKRMTPAIEEVAHRLVDEMVAQGPPADLARGLSEPLPNHTICALLDVPDEDRPLMLLRTQQMLTTAPEARQTAAEAKQHLRAYFTTLVAERRKDGGSDLITTLAAGDQEEEPLSDDELAVLALTLILSGNDTATCQISNIAYTLLTRPELHELLRRSPERLPRLLDELLRHIPFRKGVGIPRVALEDVELEGVLIRAGDFVHVSYLAANRDPKVFADPDALDVDRASHPHMTFGWGGHHCVASTLAVAELRTAIGVLFTRLPELRLAVPAQEVLWDTRTIRRFPLELPVTW
ncbi:cytochrome P450 [Streptomyces sp. WAC04114]|uniref:cytochrome P450 n=1 Tax=Streptomyces sp. WAC04114 TaxID=2867961 RepID=UPI001C8B9400|nr:cytochrome P450 [Streptomyces sp. WAC04114]MBX9359838.1 cytochrome P450 [Streptomyces sp. WAC04114]